MWPLYYINYIIPQTIEPFLALKTAWILPSQLDWIFSRSQMVIKCFNLSKSIRYLASISASDWSTTPKSFKTEALSSLLCLKKAGMQSVRLSCNARIILSRVNWPEVTLTWPEVDVKGPKMIRSICPYSSLEILEVDYSGPRRIRGSKTCQDSFYKLDQDEFVLFWCLKISLGEIISRRFQPRIAKYQGWKKYSISGQKWPHQLLLSKIIPGSTCKQTQDKLLSDGMSCNDYVITYDVIIWRRFPIGLKSHDKSSFSKCISSIFSSSSFSTFSTSFRSISTFRAPYSELIAPFSGGCWSWSSFFMVGLILYPL